jgi:hypothetical protein
MNEANARIVISNNVIEKATRKISYNAVLLCFTLMNLCALFLLSRNMVPIWSNIISIAAGVLIGWVSTWKFWIAEKGPWVLQKPPFKDDPVIPPTTIIYFSKSKLSRDLAIACVSIVFGIIVLIVISTGEPASASEMPYQGIIVADFVFMILLGIYFLYMKCIQLRDNGAQVLINDKGIDSAQAGYYSWEQIKNECALIEGGKMTWYYLVYDCPVGRIKLNIGSYGVGYDELNHLLDIYRGRSNNK